MNCINSFFAFEFLNQFHIFEFFDFRFSLFCGTNRKKKIHEVISVEALLNVCPKIPAIEEVRLKKGGWRSRIEESLTNSLDKLADDKILVCCEYCNPNCEPLSKKQIKMDSFFDFQKYRVHFKVSGI